MGLASFLFAEADTSASSAFLNKLGPGPFELVVAGAVRRVGTGSDKALGRVLGDADRRKQNVFVNLPRDLPMVQHVVVRAAVGSHVGMLPHPPSLVIMSHKVPVLIWTLAAPIDAREAQAVGERLAEKVKGRPIIGSGVPLPGSMAFMQTGQRSGVREPVTVIYPSRNVYTIAGGELVGPEVIPLASPFMRADSVEAKPMVWLWPGLIPCGCLTLLGGAPGMGKSQAAISIAAHVSKGRDWPDGSKCEAGSALVLEAEDDVERTVTPRLIAAGADLRRVGLGKLMDFSQSVDALEAERRRRRKNLRLVVLSPIRKFLGEAEFRGNLAVRDALTPILNWAERHGVAVLGICHPPKGKEDKEAFAGSAAFLEVARAAFSVIPDPESDEPIIKRKPRLLVSAKGNLGPDDARILYRIDGVKVGAIETSRIVWG